MSSSGITYPYTPAEEELDAISDDDRDLAAYRVAFGSPLDIPWYDAPHDGYPMSSSLHALPLHSPH